MYWGNVLPKDSPPLDLDWDLASTLSSSEPFPLTTSVEIDPIRPLTSSREQHAVRMEGGACDWL